MNKKSVQERVRILHCLLEGMGINATARLNNCSKNTVLRLLSDAGQCARGYQRFTVRNVTSRHVEIDELWSFVLQRKSKLWTWIAICQDSKLIISYYVGGRRSKDCNVFLNDLASRLSNRPMISSDGLHAYQRNIAKIFQGNVDYGILLKSYSSPEETKFKQIEAIHRVVINGNMNEQDISTSTVERYNLTLRTHMKRYARKTNAHSKKVLNHVYALDLQTFYYNFCRIHSSIKVTPAMESGLSDKVLDLSDLINIIDEYRPYAHHTTQ